MDQVKDENKGKLSEALYEELESLKIRIAFAEIYEETTEGLENAVISSEGQEYSEEAQRIVLKEIQHQFDKNARKRFFQRMLPRVGQMAAITLLVFFLSLVTATATVHSVRIKVMELIMKIEDQYTEIGLREVEGKDFDVPASWKGHYYPSYIPEGFSLVEIREFENSVRYELKNRILTFGEYRSSDHISVDTENCEMSFIPIHGTMAIAAIKEDAVNIFWSVDNAFFSIFYTGDLEEAEKIAQSVRMIY